MYLACYGGEQQCVRSKALWETVSTRQRVNKTPISTVLHEGGSDFIQLLLVETGGSISIWVSNASAFFRLELFIIM